MKNRIDCETEEKAAACDGGCPGPYGKHLWSIPNAHGDCECLWCGKRVHLEVIEGDVGCAGK